MRRVVTITMATQSIALSTHLSCLLHRNQNDLRISELNGIVGSFLKVKFRSDLHQARRCRADYTAKIRVFDLSVY
jgi:hypothetical protein